MDFLGAALGISTCITTLTIDYSKKFTTNNVLTIRQMSMFVVKSIVIQINGLAYISIGNGR